MRLARPLLPALACALALAPAAARAADGAPSRWLSLAARGGATVLDPSLADFRWDVTPRAAWGAQALAGRGPLALGVGVERARTEQTLAFSGGVQAAGVALTSVELVGRARVASWAGFELALAGRGGRMHVGYHPDRLTVPAAVAGTDLTVTLAPLDAWTWGGGLAARRALRGPWSLGLDLERRAYGWDAARRVDGTITVGRETFGEWDAAVELAWTAGRR